MCYVIYSMYGIKSQNVVFAPAVRKTGWRQDVDGRVPRLKGLHQHIIVDILGISARVPTALMAKLS